LFRFSAQQTGRKIQQRIHKKTFSGPFEFSFELASLVPFCTRDARSARSAWMKAKSIFYLVALICSACCGTCRAQSPQPEIQQSSQQGEKTERLRADSATVEKDTSGFQQSKPLPENDLGLALLKNLARDQKAIWTSPAHLRIGDATWLVPFAGLTAGFLVTDHEASSHLSHTPSTLRHYTSFSNYGLSGMVGTGAGLYFLGKATGDEHKREAGLLSGEAALDGLFVSTAIGIATGRERPPVNAFHGKFWQGGDSFPSSHATSAWAIASVISHEYPGPLTKILAYGAATAITYARVRGEKHFPADAFVGTGVGWLTGWQVHRAHHNTELNGGIAENLSDSPLVETDRTPNQMGSPYVPLDSWIYPLFDRLIATGAINDAIIGMRPWTRLECARMVSAAGDRLQDAKPESMSVRLYDSLRQEFVPELALLTGGGNRAIHLESAYVRVTDISGPLGGLRARRISTRAVRAREYARGPVGSQQHRRQPRAGSSPTVKSASGGVPVKAVPCFCPIMPHRCGCSISIASRRFVCRGLGDSSAHADGRVFRPASRQPAFTCALFSRREDQFQTDTES
jgi:hypothetical protein